MKTSLAAKRLITASETIDNPIITLDGSVIEMIRTAETSEQEEADLYLGEGILTAGLLDIHMHGAMGHDVMEGEADALGRIGRYLARRGISEYLATTVTASLDYTLLALNRIARYATEPLAEDEARIGGIHIEGPFLSHTRKGMHPPEFLLDPTPELLSRLWEASEGAIRLMTIAPELPGALETIRRANELGIRCSMGHSDASMPQAQEGWRAGVVSVTHTFNAMRPLTHRDPGILGFVLDQQELYADLICDGVHVAPELVRLWFKAKGAERAILITDSLEATGMPNGRYKLGQTVVHVDGTHCTTESGVLAGSVLSLDQAVGKFQEFTRADLATAIRMASGNPERMLGWEERLKEGGEATFNVYSDDGQRQATILRGCLLGV